MQLERYDKLKGRRARLTHGERERLLDYYRDRHDPQRYIGLALMAYCGVRSQEAVDARPTDIVDGDDTDRVFLRVADGKHGSERLTPMSSEFAEEVRHYSRRLDYDESILGVTTRTLRRWVTRAARYLAATEEDVRWNYVRPHDLRRTWGHLLVEDGVQAPVLMDWGGWGDYETFRKHYLGKHSEALQDREATKTRWL